MEMLTDSLSDLRNNKRQAQSGAAGITTGDAIGRGATSIIRKLQHPHSHQVLKSFLKASELDIRREITIHKYLTAADCGNSADNRRNHLVAFHSAFKAHNMWHICMERVDGGELFEKIEPDVGFPEPTARRFFSQLLSAISYMHVKGVAHRDIKPENLLLTDNGVLKVCDFGMSTYYYCNDSGSLQKRKLKAKVGTRMYAAPELLSLEIDCYDGEAVDVWSMGIVLYMMLVGDAPWSEASEACAEFSEYKLKGTFGRSILPSTEAQSLLLSMLECDPHKRVRLDKIRNSEWLTTNNHALISLSHPVPFQEAPLEQCFSQPTNAVEKVGMRFYISSSAKDVLERLDTALTEMHVQTRISLDSKQLVFSTVDKRNNQLTGVIRVHRLDCQQMVVFQRRKGDYIEFKRLLVILAANIEDLTSY